MWFTQRPLGGDRLYKCTHFGQVKEMSLLCLKVWLVFQNKLQCHDGLMMCVSGESFLNWWKNMVLTTRQDGSLRLTPAQVTHNTSQDEQKQQCFWKTLELYLISLSFLQWSSQTQPPPRPPLVQSLLSSSVLKRDSLRCTPTCTLPTCTHRRTCSGECALFSLLSLLAGFSKCHIKGTLVNDLKVRFWAASLTSLLCFPQRHCDPADLRGPRLRSGFGDKRRSQQSGRTNGVYPGDSCWRRLSQGQY